MAHLAEPLWERLQPRQARDPIEAPVAAEAAPTAILENPMRALIAFTIAVLTVTATTARADDAGTHHGAPMPKDSLPVSLASAMADPATYAQSPHAIRGEIRQVCQAKGCWAILADGDDWVRVQTHYRYALPKDASGMAVAYGTLSKVTLDRETAAHLAADGGAAKAPESPDEWRIDALAVHIEPEAEAAP
jgi:hypothetical protein